MDISISGIPTLSPVQATSGRGDTTAGLVDRFNRLMETAPAPPGSASGVPTVLTEFVHQQQAVYGKADELSAAIGRDAASLNTEQMALRQIELIQTVGRAQSQFTAATAIAQGSKSGLQTLMKNQ